MEMMPRESVSNPDINFETMEMEAESEHELQILSCENFEGLYKALKEIGEIKGAKTFTSEELIDIIEKIRNNEADVIDITRTYGLRSKVKELLQNDPVYAKHAFALVNNEK